MENYKIETQDGGYFVYKNETSISESARVNHVNLDYSCLTGRCGVCKTTVKSGSTLKFRSEIALSNQEIDEGYILPCCRRPLSDIKLNVENIKELEGISQVTLPCKIKSISKISDDVLKLELRFPPNKFIIFQPGQFIDLCLGSHLKRSYSIASSTNSNEVTLLIKRVKNGAMSEYLFNTAKIGDLLRLEGPKGTFFIRDRKVSNYIFLATGTGIAPFISILDQLAKQECKVPISLYWGCREDKDFFWDFTNYMESFDNLKVSLCPSRNSRTKTGLRYVQDHAINDIFITNNTQVYACGSLNMINHSKKKMIDIGIDSKNFFSDAFVQSNEEV